MKENCDQTGSSSMDDSPNSPQCPSFAIRGGSMTGFLRSISTKEPSFSDLPYTPSRLHTASLPSSPHHPFSAAAKLKVDLDGDHPPTISHRCVSSVLKKDGQILSMDVSKGLVYTGSESNAVRMWKLPEFTEYGQLKSRACMVVALQVSNDKVYAAYGDARIRVWSRTWDGAPRHVRFATVPRAGINVRGYISGRDKMMKHMGAITSLAINISDDILYSASLDRTVKVWRISDHKCIETIQAHTEPVNAIVVADDGVLYSGSDDATVRVWRRNFCSGDRPHSLTVTLPAKNSPVRTLSLSSDGAVLYGGCTDGYVHYWYKGWFSGQLQYGGVLQGHTHAVMCLASACNYVISGSADSTCRVWSREQDGQHRCLAVLQGHRSPVRCVAVFLDRSGTSDDDGEDQGCNICTGSLDGILKVWHVSPKGNARRRSPQHGSDY